MAVNLTRNTQTLINLVSKVCGIETTEDNNIFLTIDKQCELQVYIKNSAGQNIIPFDEHVVIESIQSLNPTSVALYLCGSEYGAKVKSHLKRIVTYTIYRTYRRIDHAQYERSVTMLKDLSEKSYVLNHHYLETNDLVELKKLIKIHSLNINLCQIVPKLMNDLRGIERIHILNASTGNIRDNFDKFRQLAEIGITKVSFNFSTNKKRNKMAKLMLDLVELGLEVKFTLRGSLKLLRDENDELVLTYYSTDDTRNNESIIYEQLLPKVDHLKIVYYWINGKDVKFEGTLKQPEIEYIDNTDNDEDRLLNNKLREVKYKHQLDKSSVKSVLSIKSKSKAKSVRS